MKINKDLLIPYSIAIGVFNFIFVSILVLLLSYIFSYTLTLRILGEHYLVGYVVLWMLNLKIIKE